MTQDKVILSTYNPEWPHKFEREKELLISAAGQWLNGSIEPIGSTSVPGLIAKPVIDIMFGVRSLDISRPAIEAIVNSGYHYYPYKKEVMHWFCKPSPDHRTYHLHLVPFQSDLWIERIRFRKLLRSNTEVAKEYSDLKRELAQKYQRDRESYTEKKWPFIKKVLYQGNNN